MEVCEIEEIKPFFIPGGRTGCLLLHGFTGTPAEMRWMGNYLAGKGLTVAGVRLAGHGTKPEDLRGITRRHWVESAENGLADLRLHCDMVFVAGLSMGGTIALDLAARHGVGGVIAMCAPVYLDPRLYLSRPFSYLLGFKHEVGRNIKDPVARRGHAGYRRAPLNAIFQFLNLLREVRGELGRIRVPVLIFQSRDDRIVPPSNGSYIYRSLTGVADKELVWLERSGHMATMDYDKELVFERTFNFISGIKGSEQFDDGRLAGGGGR